MDSIFGDFSIGVHVAGACGVGEDGGGVEGAVTSHSASTPLSAVRGAGAALTGVP